ncbi:hypothetical protein LPU83_pLPU83b_0361 (plasmid) [Rhizobium favelukesii]|uniref:Uncharacterized protein n=1 Tax=Rhizobium favelukesii TaxID=348824 RepID=W6RN64_9HYPH|nr:hypothetical protein LPU83_pLPU83b_0361 [Rhizobium favelukesii]
MNLSLSDNVLFGRQFIDGEIAPVLHSVNLGDKLEELAEGLDFQIGERGRPFCAGLRRCFA